MRVLIADDHPIVRRGLKQILAVENDIEICGEGDCAVQVRRLVREVECDVVVLDLNMPGAAGLDLLQDVREQRPRVPVLVMSIYPEEQFGVRVLRAGAAGYLSKDTAPEELVKAVRKVYSGGKYVSAALAEKLASTVQTGNTRPDHELLSNREFDVMRLIASGMSVSEIADQLFLSVKTISTYRARLLVKLQLQTNADLTQYAIQNRLTDWSVGQTLTTERALV